MSREKPTIRDVAERAGVTIGTVSMHINGGPRFVSPETKAKIDKAITDLGFRLDRNAANIARNNNSDAIRQPTIMDVAKRSGVNKATVSRVINGSKPVSPELRKRVQEAIESLSFKPNTYAQELSKFSKKR